MEDASRSEPKYMDRLESGRTVGGARNILFDPPHEIGKK
jgi:hypothetical protein